MFGKQGSKQTDLLPFIRKLVKAGKRVRDEEVEPEVSEIGKEYIKLYFEIRRWVESGGMGPGKVTLAVLNDYCARYHFALKFHEVQLIRSMDDIFLFHASGSEKQPEQEDDEDNTLFA